jgi:hypothetical protein
MKDFEARGFQGEAPGAQESGASVVASVHRRAGGFFILGCDGAGSTGRGRGEAVGHTCMYGCMFSVVYGGVWFVMGV